ncbi:MAG: sigma-54-dependent Fis family transcriptional regulator [Myxococcales bacterium]|nr:sigma-54-dependent Fis family transcriptional regulator [Myxococcales bacterium]
MRKRVLVIEDDEVIRDNILELLEEEGYEAAAAADGRAGVLAAFKRLPDVVICDIMMPEMGGYEVLDTLRDHPDTAAVPFIFLSARTERADIREGMNRGADDYVPKPYTRAELLAAIQARLDRQDTIALAIGRPTAPPQTQGPSPAIVLRSDAMLALWEKAKQGADTNLSILLLGETGTGKEVFAHAIHKASSRAGGPFVPLNCAAINKDLVESELFGTVKGAYTGAVDREGLFEAADKGTVFLDEIGELSPEIQAKLLRVLEQRQVTRLGEHTPRDFDARFIAATNQNLDRDMADGHFRKDLYYRVAQLSLTLPPLRARTEAIEPLAKRFIATACHQFGRTRLPELSPAALEALEVYCWPGNVRELRNFMETTVALCKEGTIKPEHLPEQVHQRSESRDPMKVALSRIQELEKQSIIDALERCGGNQSRAAKLLRWSRRKLCYKMDYYGLARPRKKVVAAASA